MKKNLLNILLICCIVFDASYADSKELIKQFSGSGTAVTTEFEVRAPWILDWRVNSEYQQSMAIEISLIDSSTGFLSGLIIQTKHVGNGLKLFQQGGKYRFRISSTLTNWYLKVEEITEAEIELYKPKNF